MSQTKIQKKKSGQFVVTVPRGIAQGMNLEEAEVDWNIKSQNRIELDVDRNPDD